MSGRKVSEAQTCYKSQALEDKQPCNREHSPGFWRGGYPCPSRPQVGCWMGWGAKGS